MKNLLQIALVGTTLIGSVAASQAAGTTFAQFFLAPAAGTNPFTYTGVNPLTGTSTLKGTSVPVQFEYLSTLGGLEPGVTLTPGQVIAGTFTFTAKATQGENPQFSTLNPFDTTSFSFIAATNSANTTAGISGKNLLSGTSGTSITPSSGDGGILQAADGTSSPIFSASNPANAVTFTSAVIKTNGLSEQNFSLSFTSATPSATYKSYDIFGDRFLESFKASPTGTFAATTTPEPGVLAVVGAMFVGSAFGLRRRRK